MPVPPPPPSPSRDRDAREPLPAEPLEYGQAAPPKPVFDVATAIALFPWAFVLTMLFALLTPRFEEIFRDFGTRLPMVTVLLLQGSRAFLAYGWVAVWGLAIAMPFVVAQLRRPPEPGRRRRHAAAWFISVLLCGATVLFGAVALYAPMISLIQTVSGGPKK